MNKTQIIKKKFQGQKSMFIEQYIGHYWPMYVKHGLWSSNIKIIQATEIFETCKESNQKRTEIKINK